MRRNLWPKKSYLPIVNILHLPKYLRNLTLSREGINAGGKKGGFIITFFFSFYKKKKKLERHSILFCDECLIIGLLNASQCNRTGIGDWLDIISLDLNLVDVITIINIAIRTCFMTAIESKQTAS